MSQTTTFGRRGLAAAPALPAPRQSLPALRPPPVAPAPGPAISKDDSAVGHFLWLLFSFRGRLGRTTYRWCRIVANLLILFSTYALTTLMIRNGGNLGLLAVLATVSLCLSGLWMWSTLAMQVKRRHDLDKGWPWLFVGFIPLIGPLWVLVECCWFEGTPGYNRFDEPADAAASAFA